MKARPILFTPENYGKCATGTKTQTRRIIKDMNPALAASNPTARQIMHALQCPFGTVGDRLYVKEGFCVGRQALQSGRGIIPHYGPLSTIYNPIVKYRRDWGEIDPPKWRSPLFMPKWAARLWLEIVEVRVERLQEISYQECLAEGIDVSDLLTRYEPREQYAPLVIDLFRHLWESIHGPGSWERNDWVWVIGYRRVQP